MRMISGGLALMTLAVCGGTIGACATEAQDPAVVAAPPFRHQTLQENLHAEAANFTRRHGDWLEDYGDAPFYGLAYYAYNAPKSAATWQARDRALVVLTGVDFFEDDLQEVTMSALGLISYIEATGDRSVLPTLDTFIDELHDLISTVGYYIQPNLVDSWALRTYGSTSISALLALINAEYAVRVGGERASERALWAKEAADKIATIAFSDGGWLFAPDNDRLYLYPNVAMILLDGRLFELTQDDRYRDRALSAYDAIQPLKLADNPTRYASPYSAEAMGATSSDYATLSSHNYLMLALAVLFQITKRTELIDELDNVLDTMETKLYGQWCLSDVHMSSCESECDAERVCVEGACSLDRCGHAVVHHWIDGRAATVADPEFVCTGCNLQLLYVMWYRQQL